MTLLQQLIDAVALGALYGLVAVGIGLVFGIMRLVNFAYGEIITVGGYTLAYLHGRVAETTADREEVHHGVPPGAKGWTETSDATRRAKATMVSSATWRPRACTR